MVNKVKTTALQEIVNSMQILARELRDHTILHRSSPLMSRSLVLLVLGASVAAAGLTWNVTDRNELTTCIIMQFDKLHFSVLFENQVCSSQKIRSSMIQLALFL